MIANKHTYIQLIKSWGNLEIYLLNRIEIENNNKTLPFWCV